MARPVKSLRHCVTRTETETFFEDQIFQNLYFFLSKLNFHKPRLFFKIKFSTTETLKNLTKVPKLRLRSLGTELSHSNFKGKVWLSMQWKKFRDQCHFPQQTMRSNSKIRFFCFFVFVFFLLLCNCFLIFKTKYSELETFFQHQIFRNRNRDPKKLAKPRSLETKMSHSGLRAS